MIRHEAMRLKGDRMNIEFGYMDLLLTSPLLVLFVTSLIPITTKLLRGNRELNPLANLLCVFAGLAICAGVMVIPQQSHLAFEGAIVVDGLSRFMGVLILFLTGGALFLVAEHRTVIERQLSECIFLILSAAMGMLILLWSNDLLTTFIGLELTALSTYLVIALSREIVLAREAAFKYFVMGSFASAIFLLGASLIYGTALSTNFSDLGNVAGTLVSTNRLFLFGLSLVVLGFAFKISLFPFHFWTPDVYQGAGTPITAYMATAVKAASFAVFLRFTMVGGLWSAESLFNALQWLAVATMLIGNVAALIQSNLKRMLAYSSIAHSGYVMIGLLVAAYGGDQLIGPMAFYLFTYSVMTFGAFAAISMLEKNSDTILHVEDLAGLGRKHPWISFAMMLFLLSLAGIPPLLGFFGKFYLFAVAMDVGFYWLAIWGVINSVISVYYYLRPIIYLYMHEGQEFTLPRARYLTTMAVALSAAMVLMLGFFSSHIIHLVE